MGIFKTSTVSSTSPRVSSFMVTSSSYGSVINLIFGTTMIAPLLIDYDDFTAIAHTTTTKSGGKGGSVKSSNTTYTYTVMAIMALGEGTLSGTGNIWEGSKTTSASALGLTFFNGARGGDPITTSNDGVATASAIKNSDIHVNLSPHAETIYSVYAVSYTKEGSQLCPPVLLPSDDYYLSTNNSTLTIYKKGFAVAPPLVSRVEFTINYKYSTVYWTGQAPWGYLLSNHPEKALSYSGTSYLAGVLDLGDSSSLPNFNIEVYGLCQNQQGTPSTVKLVQTPYIKTVEVAYYSSNINVQEYVYGGTGGNYWATLDSRYYSISQKQDAYGNNISTYVYTFNFDDRTDGYDRDDPLYVRINYNATTASVSFTATDANPRDIIYTLLTSTVFGANFPSVLIDNMLDYANYCKVNSLLLSPAYDSQQQTSDIITSLAEATNSEYLFSQGKAKMVPYYDGLEAIYDIKDDNIIAQDDDTISIQRSSQSDVYNIIPLEYFDRSNEYNTGMVYATDEGNIDVHGLRQASTKSHHEICSASLAQTVAQTILQKQINKRNQYTVKIPPCFVLLEGMDPVTLASDLAGLETTAVRVVSIKESAEDFTLEVVFEDNPSGMTDVVEYETQDPTRARNNLNIDPGSINYPVMFEPPSDLGNGLYVWMYASGGDNYGGCNVWVSNDNLSYKKVGSIVGKSREGILSNVLPFGTDPDTAHTLAVDLTMSDGGLVSGTQADADQYNTLCYVDGELISYETATLTAINKYNLTYLRRGAYGTQISTHDAGSYMVRMDDAVFKYPFAESDIGKTYYVKFTALNVFGGEEQELADVSPYIYTIKGTAEYSDLDPITNLRMSFSNKKAVLSWDAVADFRSPILYEVRMGASWETGLVMGRVDTIYYTVPTIGTYWIKAVYSYIYNGTTYTAYSRSAESIDVAISSITANVIAVYDEQATGWTGQCSEYARLNASGGYIYLTGQGLFSAIPKVSAISSIEWFGGAGSEGYYTIPESHVISVSSAELCNVTCSYSAKIVSAVNLFSSVQKVSEMTSFSMEDATQGACTVQINVMGENDVWGGWQDYIAGQYYGKKFNFRIKLQSYSTQYTVNLYDFTVSVDVDDKNDNGNVMVGVGGTTITYVTKFNMVPTPVISEIDKITGDAYTIANQTNTGFTISFKDNTGTAVAREINWVAIGW